jgi:hypothetical protein
MFDLSESKAQGWRAIAVLEDGSEALVMIGMSSAQIRAGYVAALQEMFEEEPGGVSGVTDIRLEQWYGAPDAGRWTHKNTLRIPDKAKLAKAA